MWRVSFNKTINWQVFLFNHIGLFICTSHILFTWMNLDIKINIYGHIFLATFGTHLNCCTWKFCYINSKNFFLVIKESTIHNQRMVSDPVFGQKTGSEVLNLEGSGILKILLKLTILDNFFILLVSDVPLMS